MASPPAVLKATHWLIFKKPPAQERFKMGSAHRAQPFSHHYDEPALMKGTAVHLPGESLGGEKNRKKGKHGTACGAYPYTGGAGGGGGCAAPTNMAPPRACAATYSSRKGGGDSGGGGCGGGSSGDGGGGDGGGGDGGGGDGVNSKLLLGAYVDQKIPCIYDIYLEHSIDLQVTPMLHHAACATEDRYIGKRQRITLVNTLVKGGKLVFSRLMTPYK
ncbi:unnamed protein product [Clonostachys solani]|uniref:Uncharacterized protein n=1 Tax=Clonostachys solani TaxID=160281 RepID=A0A9N9W1I1_9HYPO|nr:unnamed protein product [Clonostachys solani]